MKTQAMVSFAGRAEARAFFRLAALDLMDNVSLRPVLPPEFASGLSSGRAPVAVVAVAVELRCAEEVFADGREDVDEDDLLVEHGRAVPGAGWEVEHVAGRGDALL